MYDKSKKTWSQRLKITKTEKTAVTNTTATTTATHTSVLSKCVATVTTNTSATPSSSAVASNAPNFGRNHTAQQYSHHQHAATATAAATMHLPTLQLSEYHNAGSGSGGAYEYMPSALSRSMKYAEPWIYGTVRGIPARPYHHYMPQATPSYMHPHAAAIFAAHPLASGATAEALAVVICSCPEYLNGTKRDVKKASVCKKCKGSRLPLAPIGGTMRLPATAGGVLAISKMRTSGSATVRVVSSTKKARPTILDPQLDPYDLMRRTRLLSPEPGAAGSSTRDASSGSKEKARSRGKSASPVRGRSRKRNQLAIATPKKQTSATEPPEASDCWLVEDADTLHNISAAAEAAGARRSILRCNVNPYDLISIKNNHTTNGASTSAHLNKLSPSSSTASASSCSQNEFMPPNDDFNVEDAALSEEAPPFATNISNAKGAVTVQPQPKSSKSTKKAPTTMATNTQRAPVANGSDKHARATATFSPPEGAELQADDVELRAPHNYGNVQAIAGQRISLGEHKSNKKALIKQSEDGRCCESIIITADGKQASPTNGTAKTPTQMAVVTPQSSSAEKQPQRPPRSRKNESSESADSEELESKPSAVTVLTVTPTQNIKSILKRPTSRTSENSEVDEAQAATPTSNGVTCLGSADGVALNAAQRRGGGGGVTVSTATTPTATAQFYIPLPQARKKVQFRVEERVVHALDSDDATSSSDSENEEGVVDPGKANGQACDGEGDNKPSNNAGRDDSENVDLDLGLELDALAHTLQATTSNYEYYNRKREQQRQQRQQSVHKCKTTTTKTSKTTNKAADGSAKAMTTPTADSKASDLMLTQAALLAQLQHDSDLVSNTLRVQNDKGSNSNNNSNKNCSNNANNDGRATVDHAANDNNCSDEESDFEDALDEMPTETTTTTTMPQCEGVLVLPGNANNKSSNGSVNVTGSDTTQSVGQIMSATNNGGNSKPLRTAATKQSATQQSTSPTANATATTAAAATAAAAAAAVAAAASLSPTAARAAMAAPPIAPTTKALVPNARTNSNGNAKRVHKQQDADADVEVPANKSSAAADGLKAMNGTTAKGAIKTASASAQNDYDATSNAKRINSNSTSNNNMNNAAEQQLSPPQPQPLQATTPNDSASASTVRPAQSRNPIRRAYSERHQLPPAAKLSIAQNSNSSNYNKNCDSATTNDGHSQQKQATSKQQQLHQSNNTLRQPSTAHNRREVALLSFKDTMALRGNRTNRSDMRDLFVRTPTPPTGNMATPRPREPPPPPPTPPPSSAAANGTSDARSDKKHGDTKKTATTTPTATTVTARILSLSPAQQSVGNKAKNAETTTASAAAAATYAKSPTATANGLDKQQQAQQNLQNKSAATCESGDSVHNNNNINGNSSGRGMPQRQQQQGHNNNSSEATMRATTPHNIARSASQRTVVRVAPFNKTTSEVHRLKISHTDNHDDVEAQSNQRSPLTPTASPFQSPHSLHYNANGSTHAAGSDALTQQKTSILITGDDCYSTMNLSCDDASTPLYQSSVVVADYTSSSVMQCDAIAMAGSAYSGLRMTTTSNGVTINVSSPRSAAEELIYHNNKINTMLSRTQTIGAAAGGRAIIPIKGTPEVSLQRSASSTSSTSTSSMTSIGSSSSGGGSGGTTPKRGRTLIKLDYEKEKPQYQQQQLSLPPLQQHVKQADVAPQITIETAPQPTSPSPGELLSHEQELLKILRNPVEAVKRNLVPHICGRNEAAKEKESVRTRKMREGNIDMGSTGFSVIGNNAETTPPTSCDTSTITTTSNKLAEPTSFIAKLLEDPTLSQVADGLETDTVADLIENSLKRLQESRSSIDMSGTKDNDDMNRLINLSLQKIKEERQSSNAIAATNTHLTIPTATKDEDGLSNRGSISSANSFASAHNYEMFDFDANESDCYQSCSSEITSPGDDDASTTATRSKFYQMLVDATLAEIEMSTNLEEEEDGDSHHYESIRHNIDPIYEEISDVPPPLPLTAPPINDADVEKKAARSIFEGASKYDILSYLVDAKERGVVREDGFEYNIHPSNPIIIEEEAVDTLSDLAKRKEVRGDMSSRASIRSDSSEDAQSMMSSLSPPAHTFICGGSSLLQRKGASSDIERNDSGVGSETSKSSRSKFQHPLAANNAQLSKNSPLHLCEDCDGAVETQVTDSGLLFAPLVCRKCGKKRVERKEIITEIVETEEKYGRDLQIILEEFCHPMLVAGLLTQEQLSAIFLNTEELLENNQTLAERMRDALDIALEQGDDDLLTVNIGKIFLEFTQMLHAFESYCVRQAGASLLLANLEKEKELLRIFLKVSQMENAVLRRMNLNSFLMVPVQRVTKYPLLLARLYKVTPVHLEGRDQLKQAQEKIELHLNHINQEAKDVPTKLWRRISSSSPNRRASCEIDMINIKLRKMAIDILEWNHDEVRFAMEGKLLYTQPTDSNWKKARTIKLTTVNALLVTNGKPSANYKAEKVMSDKLNFPKHTGIREASLLVVKEKGGRYTLIREPLYLDRCVVCSEADWDDYFEVQEISSKDTFIFKAEDGVRTKQWYTQLQYHAQGMGAWRKRRNALANIMINGMLTRT